MEPFIRISFAGFCPDSEMHFELGIWYQVKATATHIAEDIFCGNLFSILVVKIHLYISVALNFTSHKIISSSTSQKVTKVTFPCTVKFHLDLEKALSSWGCDHSQEARNF